jgi:hypothetical protein
MRRVLGIAYTYSLWGTFFAVPVQVLKVNEPNYGEYSNALLKWWEAVHTTFYAYLQGLG